jgi:hypothetical protein
MKAAEESALYVLRSQGAKEVNKESAQVRKREHFVQHAII